jgi:uncharacterized protein YcfL
MKNLLLVAPLTAALLAGGCASEHGAYTPANASRFNQETQAKLVLMDSAVQTSVTSPTLQETRLPDGRLQVTAVLRNREHRRIQVQVQCVFKDGTWTPTGDETPWQDFILTENAQESASFTSMNDQAKNYTVRVRQAR